MTRAVLIGCGKIARTWLRSIAEFDDVQVVGLVDLDVMAAKQVNEDLELGASVSADLEAAIRDLEPDAVFDCTIPGAHRTVVETALDMGCHVLGEKPMADTMSSAIAMVKTARKSGLTYAVIQNRRYIPNIGRYRDAIHSGGIGSPTTYNADFYKGSRFGDFRDRMRHVLLLDMAIHSFDEARYLTGKDAVSAYCHEWNPRESWYDHGASAAAIFEMEDNVVFNYRGSWCTEGHNTSWQCAWRTIGTEGSILWDGQDDILGEKVSESGMTGLCRSVEPLTIPDRDPPRYVKHAGVIRDFLDAISTGSTPPTICTDNVKSVAMVHAAIRSAEEERKVYLEELLEDLT